MFLYTSNSITFITRIQKNIFNYSPSTSTSIPHSSFSNPPVFLSKQSRMVSIQRDEESNEVAMNKISDGGSSINGEIVKVAKTKGMSHELASQKHALSERKRRKRINCHYDSLRQFFPRLHKSDKASVLAETVHRLKELKKLLANLAPIHDVGDRCSGVEAQPSFFIPGENDEMTVIYVAGGHKTSVRAIICCEDRPGLNQDLTEAIHSVRGKAVKAEMATVGGRTKAEVVVEWAECDSGREKGIGLLKRALKAVVENRVLGRTGLIGHGYTEPEVVGFGLSLEDGERPKVRDQIGSGLADGLIVRSY